MHESGHTYRTYIHKYIITCIFSYKKSILALTYCVYMTLHPAVSFQNFQIYLNTKISPMFYQCAGRILYKKHADILQHEIYNFKFKSVRKKFFVEKFTTVKKYKVLSFPYICTLYSFFYTFYS
jgi:hypothetical protein